MPVPLRDSYVRASARARGVRVRRMYAHARRVRCPGLALVHVEDVPCLSVLGSIHFGCPNPPSGVFTDWLLPSMLDREAAVFIPHRDLLFVTDLDLGARKALLIEVHELRELDLQRNVECELARECAWVRVGARARAHTCASW